MKADKPKYSTFQNMVWSLARAWEYHKPIVAIIAAYSLITAAYQIADLFFAPQILARLEERAPVGKLLLTILVFTLFEGVSLGLMRYMHEMQNIRFRVVNRRLHEKVIEKQCCTSYSNMLLSKTVHLRETSENTVNNNRWGPSEIYLMLATMGSTLFSFLSALSLMTYLSLPIALISLLSAAVSLITHQLTEMWYFKRRTGIGKLRGRIGYIARAAQSVAAAKDIRIFSLSYWLSKTHLRAVDAYKEQMGKYKLRQFRDDALGSVMNLFTHLFAYAYIVGLILHGKLSVSQFVLFFSAVHSFTNWIWRFINTLLRMKRHCLDICALREFLELEEPFRMDGGEAIPQKDTYELRLENVSYRYPGAEEDVLKNVSLTICAGEKLAVVGLNGAGKTTLVRLLSGLIDPTEGRVLLDGHDIRLFDRREYYKLFSAVFQDYSIPDFSVVENVSMRLPEETDRKRVEECLKLAGLGEKLEKLKKGIDTPVGRELYEDGTLFWGGECQKLLLARALYRNAPILLLDEPTAALDPLAEHGMYLNYSAMSEGKTSLFISHRLASTRFCDRIVLLDSGVIAEEGTHESLLARGGKYRELFDVQSRYYREGVDF